MSADNSTADGLSGSFADITVLLPVYNSLTIPGEGPLFSQIDSILGQSSCRIRLIITDDASRDGTASALIARYVDTREVEIHINPVNMGQLSTLQAMMQRVETRCFALADHDDVWLPNKLSSSLKLLLSSGVDLVYTDLIVVDSNLGEIASSSFRLTNVNPMTRCSPYSALIKNPAHGCTILARSTLIPKLLPFPPGIRLHDRWMTMVASVGNGIASLEQATVLYRQHGNNVVGDVPFGLSGVAQRSRRFGGGMGSYLRDRLSQRLAYCTGLSRIMEQPQAALVLCWYYSRTRGIRVALSLPYLMMTLLLAHHAGLRNLIVDAVLSASACNTMSTLASDSNQQSQQSDNEAPPGS